MKLTARVVRLLVWSTMLSGTLTSAAQDAARSQDTTTEILSPASEVEVVSSVLRFFGGEDSLGGTGISLTSTEVAVIDSPDIEAISADDSRGPARAFKVTVRNLAETGSPERAARTYEVHIDSATGQLLKIVSTLPSYVRKVAENRIIDRPTIFNPNDDYPLGSWEFVELASNSARVDFFEAIKAVPGNVLGADRIVARLLTLRHPSLGLETVWEIQTWGAWETILSGPKELEERNRNHLRALVGPDGKLIVAAS